MIKKIQCGLLSNDTPQDKNVMWIDTSNPESFTLKLFRNGDWKPLHVVGTTRDIIERELTGYVTSHYHSYDKIINKPTTLTGYGITDCFNKTEIENLLNKKVTKVSGKSLSTNDFTNEDKSKLTNLKNYDDTQIRELIAGKANLQHQHTVTDIIDFPELYYDATAFFTSKIYPSDKYEELLEAVKAKKTVYAIIDEEGYISYVFFTSSTNSDGLSSRVLLTTMFADGGYLYINTFVLQQSGMMTLRENITGKANKATTLAGYSIGNAYTKSEVDTALATKQDTISDLEAIRGNAQKGNEASSIIASIVEAGYVFAGVATPTTNPSVPDAKVFYIANGKGTYEKFGGINVTEDDVVVLYWDTAWHKVATGIASQTKLSELDDYVKIAEIDSEPIYPADVTEIVDDYIYIYAVTDSNKRLLFGIKKDGSFEWSKGIPNHLKDYIEKAYIGYILPEGNSSAIQKSDYVLTHGILGISWQKSFITSDNPLLGIKWMLDNLDISYFGTTLNISEISAEDIMKVLNSCIKTMNERGIPVNITISMFPTWKGIEGSVSMEDYLKVVDEILSYDGNSDKVLMDGSTYKCYVSNITFLDELEYHTGHTPEELLELLDYLVSYAKEKRNDIIVHAPFSSFYNPSYHKIGSLRLTNGHCFSDLFDCYGIDIWTQDIDSNTKNILKAYSSIDPIVSYERKMNALVGFSTIAYTQDEQAINYFKHTLKYLSYGANIFLPFSPDYYMGEYYILEPVLSNASHLYIRMGDNSNMSITDGDGYDDIILRFGANSWTAKATIIMSTVSAKTLKIVDNLKSHGIWISGNTGLYVSKVSIVHNNGTEDIIWQGSVDVSSSPLIISKDSFSTITSTDKVVISTNAEVANGLNNIIPRKAAMCFKHLCKILHKGCTRPTIKTFGDTTIAMWNDDSNRPIYALWSESESNEIPVSIEGNYYITDIYGNIKDINEISSISEPIIIMNSTKIKLK